MEVQPVVEDQIFDHTEAYLTEFYYDNKEYGTFSLPVIIWGEDIFFFAREVLHVLGYVDNFSAILRRHTPNRALLSSNEFNILKNYASSKTSINPRGENIIPENDFYNLVMRSDVPYAENFQKWVTGEVIPSIRKTGRYSMKKEEPAQEPLQKIIHDVGYAFDLYEKFGYPKSEASLFASKLGEEVYGINLLKYAGETLPPKEINVDSEPEYLTASQLVKYIENVSRPSDVNKLLHSVGLLAYNTRRHYSDRWVPTSKGYEYGARPKGCIVRWKKDYVNAINELIRKRRMRSESCIDI